MELKFSFKVVLLLMCFGAYSTKTFALASKSPSWWEIQSVDTAKYSRDLARQNATDKSFEQVINQQVKYIADMGATHVAIDTPYDDEFLPFLKKWVKAARDNNLHVWYRGNFSGWEGWFDYPKISRDDHIQKTKAFIQTNKDLFEDGDIFTPCPECENGGPGDPRLTGDVDGFRKFMIDEYSVTQDAFKSINKKVTSNLNSMNDDIAKAVMDKATTQALGGVVTIDHYVVTPDNLANGVQDIALQSGGRVFLGEFGVPILDINGDLTETQQSDWINSALQKLSKIPELYGLNYWTSNGGSTALFNEDGTPRKVVNTIKKFYIPRTTRGVILNEIKLPIKDAYIKIDNRIYKTDSQGQYAAVYISDNPELVIQADGYKTATYLLEKDKIQTITLEKTNKDIYFRIIVFFQRLYLAIVATISRKY